MKYFFIIFLLIILAVPVCLFFFIRKILSAFGVNTRKKSSIVLTVAIALAVSVGVMVIGGFGAIVILHVAAFELLMKLVCLIVRKAAGNKYDSGFAVWKKVYGISIIPIVLTAVFMLYGLWNMNNVIETSYTVYTDKDIREEGYRVALIADVHFGVSLDIDELYEKCDEISGKGVDIVVLDGDIVDNSTTTEEMHAVFDAFGGIESKYGVFYTFGNHDRPMRLLDSPFTGEELIRTIEENGITILEDEVYEVTDDLVLIGRADKSMENGKGRLSISELLKDMDHEDFLLTLDHQPNQYKENGETGTDLLLSGHTHGGQLFPVNLIMEIIPFNDGVYGEYAIDGDTTAIVTSGFAAWSYPVKTAAPSEYVIIDIKNKK